MLLLRLQVEECPEFFKMITTAIDNPKAAVLMNIEGYQTLDEAYLLMRQLWLAHENWIEITFIPKSKK